MKFDALKNLDDILTNSEPPSPEMLKACAEAVKQIAERKDEDVDEWAKRLAADLAQFRD